MPSGKPIDWSQYDDILKSDLPSHTIAEWRILFTPHISEKAIAARARKLGIKPIKYKPTKEHKDKISKSLIGDEVQIVSKIIEMREIHSNRQIMEILGIDDATLSRIYKRNNIILNDLGVARAHRQMRECSIGKVPWNKGGKLSEDTRSKISEALRGVKNGQFGVPISYFKKQKMKMTYAKSGLGKMRSWHTTDAAKMARQKMIITKNTPENKQRASDISSTLVASGRLKHRGLGTLCHTQKAGLLRTKSTYETAFVKILELDTTVISFRYESIKIPYSYDGCIRFYVPDFLVQYQDKQVIVEIKPSKLVSLDKNQAKFEAAASFAANHSMEFKVVTENDLFGRDNR
jgi:hypothetical protein